MLKGLALIVLASTACFVLSCDDAGENAGLSSIILYQTSVTTNGDIGGRNGADALCRNELPTGWNGATVHAFLSVDDEDDEIRDMPGRYSIPTNEPIVGVNGTEIATNWNDLLDGSIENPLEDAGVEGVYWTGSIEDGSNVEGLHCNNWTGGIYGPQGIVGTADESEIGWLGLDGAGCENAFPILCIAYVPT